MQNRYAQRQDLGGSEEDTCGWMCSESTSWFVMVVFVSRKLKNTEKQSKMKILEFRRNNLETPPIYILATMIPS